MEIGMSKLMEFGVHKHSLVGNLRNISVAFVVMLMWTIAATVMFTTIVGLGTAEIRNLLSVTIYQIAPPAPKPNYALIFFMSCVFAPIWEELVFRYGPLRLARSADLILAHISSHKIRRLNGVEYDYNRGQLYGSLMGTGFIFPMMLISSVVFGVMHGSVLNIMFQGVGGFIFAWVMLKGGYVPAVITHSLWNFMLAFGMPIVLR